MTIGGTIQFASAVYSVPQDVASGLATITLTRTGGIASGVTVRARTGDLFAATTPPQTGAAGADYTSTDTVVAFNAGDTSAVFTVPIINDGGAASGVKTVNLQLVTPLPAGAGAAPNLGAASTALLRIIDATQTVGFTLANFDVSEAAGTATVQIERTGDISGSLTVNYATANGTALAGVHYETATGTVTFSGNQAVASFTVPIIDNKVVSTDKVLNLSLSAPSAGTVVNTATLTIKDDDAGRRDRLRRRRHSWSPRAGARPRSGSCAAAARPAARARWSGRRPRALTPRSSRSRPPMARPPWPATTTPRRRSRWSSAPASSSRPCWFR